jgi:hypothetical protein
MGEYMRVHGVALMFGVLSTGCWSQQKVDVQCQGIGPGFSCTLASKGGWMAVDACWRISVLCKNGTEVTADACQRVGPGAEASKFIPLADVKNVERCDAPGLTKVEHLVISAAK